MDLALEPTRLAVDPILNRVKHDCVRPRLYGFVSFPSLRRSFSNSWPDLDDHLTSQLNRRSSAFGSRWSCARNLSGLRKTGVATPPLCARPWLFTWVAPISRVPARRLHEVTNLKRAGPPRAGPIGPLNTKVPAATRTLRFKQNLAKCGKNSASSDGTGDARMICAFETGMGEGHCD